MGGTLVASGDLLQSQGQQDGDPSVIVTTFITADGATIVSDSIIGTNAPVTTASVLDYAFFNGLLVLDGAGTEIGAFTLSNPTGAASAAPKPKPHANFSFVDNSGVITESASATAANATGKIEHQGLVLDFQVSFLQS